MGSQLIIYAAGIVAFLSLYIFFNTNQKNEDISNQDPGLATVNHAFFIFFKFITFALFLFCLFLMAKAIQDEANYCDVMPVNATVTGSLTQYDYQRVCFNNPYSTAQGFYDTTLWYMRIVFVFFIILSIYNFFIIILKWIRRRK